MPGAGIDRTAKELNELEFGSNEMFGERGTEAGEWVTGLLR